jgi:hypothetical protein
MPAISRKDAVERLAHGVAAAKTSDLGEIYAELFPERSVPASPVRGEIVSYIRNGLEAEEIMDLWNFVFPADHNVWYDEEEQAIRYNEEMVGSAA